MYLQIENSYNELIESGSALARGEKNDCVVRSLAAASGIAYNSAHKFCKEEFKRVDRRGTKNEQIVGRMEKASKDGIELDGRTFDVKICTRKQTRNLYKLHGEEVWRQKTLKSFVQANPEGTFIVLVAKHALTIQDGELIDWKGMTFLPTRKVQSEYELIRTGLGIQLALEF